MSELLDAAACSDAQRREDLARNDAALKIGCPECAWGRVAGCWRCGSRVSQRPLVEGNACRATGNHRVAQNDEPEPSEEDWVQFDYERNVRKGERLAARNDARAIEWQLIDFRAKGLL